VQREWLEKDYYSILGVAASATPKEITAAYRKLARKFHPDANPGDSAAEDRFKEVSAAYEVVGDPDKRTEYDEVRRMGPSASAFGGFDPTGGSGGARFDSGDLGDLLGNLFTRGRPGGGGRAGSGQSVAPRRGADVTSDLQLEFLDAIDGATASVSVDTNVRCDGCHGSGAAAGTAPRACPSCGGAGSVEQSQGGFSFRRPCPSCAGVGRVIEQPCRVCGGTGAVRRPNLVKVRVPRGMRDGQQIRVKGKGGAGTNGGPVGDLYVRVHVAPHPAFGRDGDHLTLVVPISYPEAALGADIELPTLDGDNVTIRIPAGTRSGRTFRVRGRGVTTAKGTGDLLATVEVVVPADLSEAERSATEALAAALVGSPRDELRETVRAAGFTKGEESDNA